MEKANPSKSLEGQRDGITGRLAYAMKNPYKGNPDFKRQVSWNYRFCADNSYSPNMDYFKERAQTIDKILRDRPRDLDKANTLGHELMEAYMKWGCMDKSAESQSDGNIERDNTFSKLAYELGKELIVDNCLFKYRSLTSKQQYLESARFYWEVMDKLTKPLVAKKDKYSEKKLGFLYDRILHDRIIEGYYSLIADVIKEGDYDHARLFLKQAQGFDELSGGKDGIRLAMIGLEMALVPSGNLQKNDKQI